jgi:hypothetical protein
MNETAEVLFPDTGLRGTMADFVDRFRTIWENPQAHLDHFLDFLSPDIHLIAPIVGMTTGREAGYRAFRDAFDVLPDMHGVVHGWSATGECLFIEMDFIATVGGRRTVWRNVDRFTFREGVAIERRAFFDPLPLLAGFARRPSGWIQLWKLATQKRNTA